jgi:pimeloyl-ACP methyl ester carboxylesterase
VIQPFEAFWLGPDRLGKAAGRPPLLLIHGYQCNRGFWFRLRPWLEAAGWTVATHNLEPAWADIDSYADGIERRIDEVLAATGTQQVILVGHSMGGLVLRAYLRRHGREKVARIVTLGSPHQGTRLAPLGLGCNARQMRIDSSWRPLSRGPEPCRCRRARCRFSVVMTTTFFRSAPVRRWRARRMSPLAASAISAWPFRRWWQESSWTRWGAT